MNDYAEVENSMTVSGFWVYLMTDCILFSTFFAAFFVLHKNTYGGPSAKDIFELPTLLIQTLLLLTSSFTCGLALLPKLTKKKLLFWLSITFLCGASFVFMEKMECDKLLQAGYGPERSAYLTSIFFLVGLHGYHILVGLLWMIVLTVPVILRGFTPLYVKRLTCFRFFWHFLDLVWIFIFTVDLMDFI